MKTLLKLLASVTVFVSAPAMAHEGVHVTHAWVRATVAHQQATGAFMTLDATLDSKLVRASSPVSAQVEIHEMALENDVMRMRQVPYIAIPAGTSVELKPGGYHIMLLSLKQPIRAGDHVPLTLVFEHSNGQQETVTVDALAQALTAGNTAPQHSHHHK